MSPNTTYAVVVVPSNVGETVGLAVTTSDNEDADDTEEGWSLADAFDIEGTGGMWSAHPEGKSLLLRVRAVPTDGPPGKPAELTATAMGRHQIDLAWTTPLDGGSAITGYKIESSTDGETTWSDLVADTASDVASYSHTGLSPNTTVHYRVSAISALGTSSASDPANDTTDDFPAVTVQFGQAFLLPGRGRNGQRDRQPQRGPPAGDGGPHHRLRAGRSRPLRLLRAGQRYLQRGRH